MLKRYIWNVLIAIDQFFNVIFGGDPDETISSRLGKWLDYPKTTLRYKIANIICFLLRKLDEKHCRRSIEKDEGEDAVIK